MKKKPDDHINDFTTLYEHAVGTESMISWVISGHLVIEFLLRKLIQISDARLVRLSDEMNHHRLILLNHDLGTLSDSQKETLLKINSLRNRFAHQISYRPTIVELKELYQTARRAFSDLTDGIAQGQQELDSATDPSQLDDWVIKELFVQISYDLHHKYLELGGDLEEF